MHTEFFQAALGDRIGTRETLAGHVHFRIGGAADYFYTANTLSELKKAVELARERACPFFLMGGGYNLLCDDNGYRGMVIENAAAGISRLDRSEIRVSSGTPLRDIIRYCIREGLTGAEFLAGIPGTLGGAVFGNAGAFNHTVGELISRAVLLKRDGSIGAVDQEYFEFGYRCSILKETGELVLEADLGMKEQACSLVQDEVERNLAARKGKHPPWGVACAGSYFKNPILPGGKKVPAGYLLEKAGAKKLRVGDAAVYRKHANFIINKGNATCREVRALAEEMRKRVKNKYQFDLEEEVIYLPAIP